MPALIALLALAFIASANAHSTAGTSTEAGEWFLIGLLLGVGACYAYGLARVLSSSRSGRAALLKQACLFAAGWLVMAGSLLTPLHEMGGRSFTAHMIEHELLMLIAAPLMAWSKPLGVFMWALSPAARHRLAGVSRQGWFAGSWSALSAPLPASLLQGAAMWLWHAPKLFNAALVSEGWHAAQHLSFVFSALLFWWSLNVAAARGRPGIAAFWLFFTSIHSGFLGALMTFAQSPWYPHYVELGLSGVGGLTPLEDQQLAGVVMWIPGGMFHAVVALFYVGRWLNLSRTAVPLSVLALCCFAPLAANRALADTLYISDEDQNVVHVLDTRRGTVSHRIKVGLRPRGMALDEVAGKLYVAVSNDNRIDVVDLASSKVIGTLPSGPDPEVIALHPDRSRIYVANEADNLVSVVDIAGAKTIAEVPIGSEPEGMAISPDGKYVIATSEASSMAHFLDISGAPSQPVLLKNVMVDTRPRFAKFTANSERVWVSSELRGTVSVFETRTQRRLGRIDFERSELDGDTLQAVGIEITRDDKRAFVALGRGNQVAEVDPETFEIIRAFPAGFRVWNIALAPDESHLYAIAGLSAELTIIDLKANRVASTLKIGGKPWGIVAAR
jgi:PQQ-dependent catabolism-associated beta-propeller protein